MIGERIMRAIFWVSVISYPIVEVWWQVVKGMGWPD